MADKTSSSGNTTVNDTTTTTSGGNTGTTSGVSDTNATTRGGEAGSVGNMSSATTKDVKTMDISEKPATSVLEDKPLLPFPHTALTNADINATVYTDLVSKTFEEHEKALKEDNSDIQLSQEMLAAREDSQARLRDELSASLLAQRSTRRFVKKDTEGDTKVKLSKAHTHSGVYYEAGETISVDKDDADFIVASDSGEIVS